MTHTFLTDTPLVIYSQYGNRIESRIYITLVITRITKLSITDYHKQLCEVKTTVTAPCLSLIQTIFMLFIITQRAKHVNYKVCCKSNKTDFIYKKSYC